MCAKCVECGKTASLVNQAVSPFAFTSLIVGMLSERDS